MFGKVISGWDVVQSIANVPVYKTNVDFGQPITPVFVTSIVILKVP